jgi:hypothetical protein
MSDFLRWVLKTCRQTILDWRHKPPVTPACPHGAEPHPRRAVHLAGRRRHRFRRLVALSRKAAEGRRSPKPVGYSGIPNSAKRLGLRQSSGALVSIHSWSLSFVYFACFVVKFGL